MTFESSSPPSSPTIIAIEGLDASGKTTQALLLADALRDRGSEIGTLSFPRYDTFFGSRIGALLRGSEAATADTLDPRSMALWFAMDRWDAVATALPSCEVLLINRWTLSNAVYQGARATDPADADGIFDWVLELEMDRLSLPVPALTVLFDISVATSMKRAAHRAAATGGMPDVYESHETLLRASRRLYQRAAQRGHGVILDVEGKSPDQVHLEVMQLVDRTLA